MAQGVKGTGSEEERQRRYLELHGPEVIAQKERNRHLVSSYGITSEDYNSIFLRQDKKCAICRREVDLVVDHDHDTGKVRGLLCRTCNSAIDLLDLQAAEDYLLGAKPLQIIGITGFLRTGKDSVAALLQKFGYQKVAFADPLRKMALDIDPYIGLSGVPAHVVNSELASYSYKGAAILYSDLLRAVGYEKAKEIPDFRRFLQRLGTEGVRNNFSDDTWVKLFRKQLEPHKSYVVSDCRFPNEAQAIRNLGGEVWRTERPGYGAGPHPSEAEVLNIVPDVILNATNLIDLGTLVLRELGCEADGSILRPWADAILSNA